MGVSLSFSADWLPILLASALCIPMSCGTHYLLNRADTPSPSTAQAPTAPLLPTPGDTISWGEGGPCYALDAVQPSSDGVAWVWMHHCGRQAEKPTILTVEEWRRYAVPRTTPPTTPTHGED